MRKTFTYRVVTLVFFILSSSCSWSQNSTKEFKESFSVQVENSLAIDRKVVLVTIPFTLIKSIPFNPNSFIVMDGENEIASQYNHKDQDTQGIVVVLDKMQANEKRKLVVRYNKTGTSVRTYTKRTQAELSHKVGGHFENREYIGGDFKNVDYLRVPPEHKDHSWFIRYEGPGWESDKVGYRFYLDQRNATDVFGKLKPEMALQKAGLDGFDSYHQLQEWGMDVMKVGKSVGVGSIASFFNNAAVRVEKTDSVDCRITENGAVYSSILTRYFGWQVGTTKHDVHSRLSIHAGTRLTHQRLTISNALENIATGIVKDKASTLITDKGNNQQWAYLATYGKQSLNNDNLGLAVFFNPALAKNYTADEFSDLVTLTPVDGKVDYYFLATWEKEPRGITTEKQFREYIMQVATELANPVVVTLLKKK